MTFLLGFAAGVILFVVGIVVFGLLKGLFEGTAEPDF